MNRHQGTYRTVGRVGGGVKWFFERVLLRWALGLPILSATGGGRYTSIYFNLAQFSPGRFKRGAGVWVVVFIFPCGLSFHSSTSLRAFNHILGIAQSIFAHLRRKDRDPVQPMPWKPSRVGFRRTARPGNGTNRLRL